MDAFRRARGLLTAAATEEWMARHSLSHLELDRLVAGEAAVAGLRKREVAADVPAYFEENRSRFDSARIARLVLPTRLDAERVVAAVIGGADFCALAEAAFVEGTAAGVFGGTPVRAGTGGRRSGVRRHSRCRARPVRDRRRPRGHPVVERGAVRAGRGDGRPGGRSTVRAVELTSVAVRHAWSGVGATASAPPRRDWNRDVPHVIAFPPGGGTPAHGRAVD
jgi:hypothetical protein